ncbi:MAG TPA: molybdenum cofactor guanylyltransferase, partial [Actinomycetota bacterium]|nr:molybdenum cofactor guanylyltransferase [Actinomycetota bacterium]
MRRPCRSRPRRRRPATAGAPEPEGVTGIVLAGGRSTRFGRDKLAEPYRGAPILHHTLRRLADVCDDLVVVIAPGAPEPDLPVGVVARYARDALEGEGPLVGASAGLAATRTDLALLAGGDMPELSTAVVLEMLRVARESAVECVALRDGDRLRPLPSLVRVDRALELSRV